MIGNMERRIVLLKRAACMAACLACLLVPARADDLDDFNRAVETAMSHRRVAAEYLRTGNIDLAVLEIDGMRAAWGKVSTLPRPAAFRDQQRCDGMAPVTIRGHPEFRRLIDGAVASLAQVPQAAEARDRDLLHRLLIELRSFDHLLAFRYG